jgi:phage terminase large subunit
VTHDIVALLAEVHDDPAAFWRLVLRGEPRRWQAAVCEEIRLRLEAGERHLSVLIRSCHGAGKTTLAVVLSLWWTATRPHSRGLTTAPTWAAVEGVFWIELARLFSGSLLARAGFGRLLTTELSFEPGWDLVGLSTDHPVNLEGRHSPTAAVRVVDEAKAVEGAVFESTEALLDAPETLDVWISTPSIPSGPFFDRDVKGRADVIRSVVTINDLIAEGLPGKADWQASRLAEWGENSPEYQSRAMARYMNDAEGALFPFAWVERAMAADFDVPLVPVAGLDVAGSVAGDETALALLAGPDVLGRCHVRSVTSWRVRDTQESKGRALALVREAGANVLAVDVVGLGKGVADSIRQDFPGVSEFRASDRAEDPERFTNLKAETAWKLRGLLEAGRIRLPQSATLKAQLLGMRYAITPQGKIRVVDPPDSPDLVDSVLIALAGQRSDVEFLAVFGGRLVYAEDEDEDEGHGPGDPLPRGTWDDPPSDDAGWT